MNANVGTWNPLLRLLRGAEDFFGRLRIGDECRPEPMLQRQPPPDPFAPYRTAPVSQPSEIQCVGAWAGSGLLRDPYTSAKKARELKLDELHFMVADHSACRAPMGFLDKPKKGRRVASLDQLEHIAIACQRNGIRLGLTTWIMAHPRYAHGCGEYLTQAVRMLSAYQPKTKIIIDAEEPFTLCDGANWRTWRASAEVLGQHLEPLKSQGVEIGLTGIGYARESALDYLAEFCGFAVPQVYCTTRNKLDPSLSPARFAKRWTAMFELKRMAIGLAAYRQPKGGMTAALEGARAVARNSDTAMCDEIIYWSLANLDSEDKRAFVAAIKEAR